MPEASYSVIINHRIGSFKNKIKVDSDKSISQRGFIIGSISEGVSKLKNVLESDDIFSLISCLKKLNCKIKKIKSGEYEVYGKGLGSLYCKKILY